MSWSMGLGNWVEGFPLYAWTLTAFKKVVTLYGTVMSMDDDLEEQRSYGRVCVNSTNSSYIWDTIVVSINGRDFSSTNVSNFQSHENESEFGKECGEGEDGSDSEEVDEDVQLDNIILNMAGRGGSSDSQEINKNGRGDVHSTTDYFSQGAPMKNKADVGLNEGNAWNSCNSKVGSKPLGFKGVRFHSQIRETLKWDNEWWKGWVGCFTWLGTGGGLAQSAFSDKGNSKEKL
ncbi:hypothetical protein L2E82_47822 [Cichorium intybus]|uniref:Uncharacterized protein n=1 Tax=Cichorium intybus TaxID=13427 RepID=A0ACB8YWF3_CICIN|nr:hypothetical protein L2E82_47822 [Cichorium intybus]